MEETMIERRETILDRLKQNGSVRAADLSKEFDCSEVTIRRDIRQMAEQGLLRRTHGGAVLINKEDRQSSPASSINRNTQQKIKIAQYAYEFIEEHDTIILDDASTSYFLARQIIRHPEKHVVVVTNSLLVATELAGVSHVELYMVGGNVGGHLAATFGERAVQEFSHMRVDKAFIGVHGINFDVGLTSVGTLQREIKRAIMNATKKTFVLADSSKFHGGYLAVICPLSQIHKIITDDGIEPECIRQAQKQQISMVVAK